MINKLVQIQSLFRKKKYLHKIKTRKELYAIQLSNNGQSMKTLQKISTCLKIWSLSEKSYYFLFSFDFTSLNKKIKINLNKIKAQSFKNKINFKFT